MRTGKTGFAQLFRSKSFKSRIISIVLDEGHCISQWNSFRPEYKEIGRLHSILPGCTFHIASATLPDYIMKDVLNILNISPTEIFLLHRSNDRPNVAIVVREARSVSTYADLDFLIPSTLRLPSDIPKTYVYVDNIQTGGEIMDYLNTRLDQSSLSTSITGLVRPFNATLSPEYRTLAMEHFRAGNIRIMVCTDAAGMVSYSAHMGIVSRTHTARQLLLGL